MSRTGISRVRKAAGVSRFCSIKGKRQRTLEVLVALSIAGSTMAYADVVDLGALTAAQGVKYNGPYAESNVGAAAVGVGDLNGDGFGEAVLGAPGDYVYTYNYSLTPHHQGLGTHAGTSYVVFGKNTLGSSVPTANLYDLAAGNGPPAPNPVNFPTAGFRIDGRADYSIVVAGKTNKGFGANIVAVGDVNNDGKRDFIVGARKDTGDGGGLFGRAYLIFGNQSANTKVDARDAAYNLLTPTVKGAIIRGVGGELGTDVAGLGDFNGDGIDDFAIGAPALAGSATTSGGSVFVVFGSATLPSTIDLSTLGAGGLRINGENDGDYAGLHIAGAGNFGGDSKKDLIISSDSFEQNVGGVTNEGGAFVIYGSTASGTVNLRTAASVYIKGLGAGKYSGASVAGGGDINGDGFSEVIVGSPGAYNAAVSTNSGVGSVVLGGASLPSMIDLAALGYSGVRIFGQENDYAGSSVGFAGDVNNDGFDDVLVGAEGAKNGVVLNTGGAYLVLGRAAIAGATVQAKLSLSSEDPARSFFGGASGDRAGRFVGAAGDMNNDGFDDFFVGAPMASPGGKAGAGTAYLIMGQSAAAVIDWSMYK